MLSFAVGWLPDSFNIAFMYGCFSKLSACFAPAEWVLQTNPHYLFSLSPFVHWGPSILFLDTTGEESGTVARDAVCEFAGPSGDCGVVL